MHLADQFKRLAQAIVILFCLTALSGALFGCIDPGDAQEQTVLDAQKAEAESSGAQKPTPDEGDTTMADSTLFVEIGGVTFDATLEDNATSEAFRLRLPLTLEMLELNGNEKYFQFADTLPADPQALSSVEAGDIMLYGNNCIVIFYKSHSTSYSYTPIGKITNPEHLAEAVGSGSVEVTFTTN